MVGWFFSEKRASLDDEGGSVALVVVGVLVLSVGSEIGGCGGSGGGGDGDFVASSKGGGDGGDGDFVAPSKGGGDGGSGGLSTTLGGDFGNGGCDFCGDTCFVGGGSCGSGGCWLWATSGSEGSGGWSDASTDAVSSLVTSFCLALVARGCSWIWIKKLI